MKRLALTALLAFTVATISNAAEGIAYKPGGQQWAKAWTAFYNGDHEAELMTPLIKAGPKMVPVIIEAISNKDMQLRRYAIGALGNLNDARAVEPLTKIVNDKTEEEYFRSDALEAIYRLDQEQGTTLARQVAGQGDMLKMTSTAILKKEPSLLAGLTDDAASVGQCDVEAYVIDKDPDGLNVRSEPRSGSIVGNLPRINPPNGMIVHLIGEKPDGGWLQIDRGETTGGETPFAGSGWVSGNMLGVTAKSSDGKGAKLYEANNAKSKVAATVPHRTLLTISGCDRKWLRVKYNSTTGWLAPDAQCANPAGRCD